MGSERELFSNPKKIPVFERERDFVKSLKEEENCVFCDRNEEKDPLIPAGSPAWSMPGKESKQENGRVVTSYVKRNYSHWPDCENPTLAKSKPKSDSDDKKLDLFEK